MTRVLMWPGAAVVVLAFVPAMLWAIVDASLQPSDLYERYRTVAKLQIEAVDYDAGTVELQVRQVYKGELEVKRVRVSMADPAMLDDSDVMLTEGEHVVAFVGGTGRRTADNLLFYTGQGLWQTGKIELPQDGVAAWRWTEALDWSQMGGTFNGHPDRLAEMMADRAVGRHFFPADPITQFRADQVIGQLAGPVRAVAMYDVNGDGRLDIYADSEAGDRLYLQTDAMQFEDHTQALGLAGLGSPSVSFADVNASGKPDLLAGGRIYLQQADGAFEQSDRLPAELSEQVKTSAFVEINGDGYPDVVTAHRDGGLRIYLNPGTEGGAFEDATDRLGLDEEASGADQSGFFFAGDWNGDHRTDLFFAVGRGLLLVQGEDGRFVPDDGRLSLNFQVGGESRGLTGAGAFAPLWRPGAMDMVIPMETEIRLVGRADDAVWDFTPYANEISEASFGHLASIAEDLNADGYVDVYTISRLDVGNVLHDNRGYGSFMLPGKYKSDVFADGSANGRATLGVAVGDITGDGTNDLLLGGKDGSVTLLVNDVLSSRTAKEHPTHHEQKLLEAKMLAVNVTGDLGVLGARVELSDEQGRIVGLREIGSNIATGCRGPDQVTFVIREATQPHVLTVRYADGLVREWPIDLNDADPRMTFQTTRE